MKETAFAHRPGALSGTAAAARSHHRRETCRACAGRDLAPVLSLGDQPLANAFLRDPAEFAAERRFPLDVAFCNGCGLVQLVDVIDPAVLFSHYLYVTGTSETIARHNRAYAAQVRERLELTGRDLVVEIASNDGSLLSCFQALGVRVLGVEPASNIAAIAMSRGVETRNVFFDEGVGRQLRETAGPARAVIANNVLAHVDDPSAFLLGCRHLVADDGLVVVEVPYARDMLEGIEYDTIYHEHLSYFALRPLVRMAAAAGLGVVAVDRVAVHGGSIRVSMMPNGRTGADVSMVLAEEEAAAVNVLASWLHFGHAVATHRDALRALLDERRTGGRSIAGYGAPAKGNTLLNYCGIGPDVLPFTVDRSPLKVGLFTPGMHIPVRPVEALVQHAPSSILLLPWNFAEEIMEQQRWHGVRGGAWILPIPHPRLA